MIFQDGNLSSLAYPLPSMVKIWKVAFDFKVGLKAELLSTSSLLCLSGGFFEVRAGFSK